MQTVARLAEEYERRLLGAIFSRDRQVMAELMDPDGFGLDASMGLVRQRDLIDRIDALDPGAGFAMDEVAVLAQPDAAVLAYRLRQWGTFGGSALPATVYCSSVWRIAGDRWQAVFHHETPASA
jgi:ketosteroid isomerase-like protein